MSATSQVNAPAPASPSTPSKARLTSVDREFLPADLEILETPPSPVSMWLLLGICALAISAVTWAFIGRIDIIAIAQGKIQPVGQVKLVQPLVTGKVRTVLVENGKHVGEGDVVVELDDSEARADDAALVAAVASSQAEALRRRAAIKAVRSGDFTPPVLEWPQDIPPDIKAREERVLSGDLAQVSATLESFHAQQRQKEAERDDLTEEIASQQKLLDIEDERVQLRSVLEKDKLGSRLTLLDAEETLQGQRTSLTQKMGQLAEANAAIEVLERDAEKTTDTFVADNAQKLADAERQGDESSERLVKARAVAAHMVLRAPVSGVVEGLTITSVGQVVMPGEEVMRIVPDEGGLEIECYVPNKDIGFVGVGQEAVVKVDSFPFTQYGALDAKVVQVGKDAIPEQDTLQQETDPFKAQKSTFLGGGERTQNLYFPVTLKPDQTFIGDKSLEISNGMSVTVEIKTGERRIIDYLFSPLVEIGSRALKER